MSATTTRSTTNGLFVVIEGIDGAGTTTQCTRYAARLRAAGRRVHVTREPSAGPVGALLRQVLTHRVVLPKSRQAQTMALLFAADRRDHLAHEVEPRLAEGYVVLSDRYDLSSLTYQSLSEEDKGYEVASPTVAWIRALNQGARRPDVTVVIDVSPEVAAERRRARGGAEELLEAASLQARLARAYRSAEAFVPGDRLIHVDGDDREDAVAEAVAAALDVFALPGG
jgi:dTMP kinase